MEYKKLLVLLLTVAACCSLPVLGATKYFGASPDMSASISGVNEFSPGDDATISVIVRNNGVNFMVFNNSGVLQQEDLPTTAKLVSIGLSSPSAPITIKTDPISVGDVLRQGTKTVQFNAKIYSNATIGEYQLPLTIKYKYLIVQDQEVSDTLHMQYYDVTDTIPLTVKIKPTLKISVLEAVPENLMVGTEGYLNLTIKNTGSVDGKKATVKIIRNGNSPVIPTDSSVFIGDFPVGSTVTCRYKVAASSQAQSQTYPIDVAVTYMNAQGDTVTSVSDTVGVMVGGKINFNISSDAPTLNPGETNVVSLNYQNTGTTTAYNAQARLNAVAPFSSTDTSAYLGDIKPGEQATARYVLTVDGTATPATYHLDTEVRYRDVLDNSQISDSFTADVQVISRPASDTIVRILSIIVVVAVVVIGAGYYVLVKRKKK
ncbi:MAG: S-layer protein [Methanoregula sp.]|nr:S-layer protein [Methanoregula sp.]